MKTILLISALIIALAALLHDSSYSSSNFFVCSGVNSLKEFPMGSSQKWRVTMCLLGIPSKFIHSTGWLETVWSFGVVMYEMLHGEKPKEVWQRRSNQIWRIKTEIISIFISNGPEMSSERSFQTAYCCWTPWRILAICEKLRDLLSFILLFVTGWFKE